MEEFMKNMYVTLLISMLLSGSLFCMENPEPASANKGSQKKLWYKSHFSPPNNASKEILVKGQILAENEQPHQMIERVVNAIAVAEIVYENLKPNEMLSTAEFSAQLGTLMDEHAIVMSTPILTNAGRFNERPLSACVMPPVDLKADLKKIKQIANQYHQDGMGTGYNLSELDDPVKMLKYLNKIAIKGAASKKEQRPVGNMAILDVNSPAIEEFIMAKVDSDARGQEWKFNISVNITDDFMKAVEEDREFTLRDGKKIWAKKLFEKIAEAAHQCGDPGLISLQRLNKDNPTPSVGEYKCTAPCAEVGLAPGETCVFGYINLAKLVTPGAHPSVDFDKLQSIITLLTRALDNILEISIQRYSIDESKSIMAAKRKIGIGVCGFADMLMLLNLSYQQNEARELLQDILNFISYHSKEASFELAKSRGSFTAISQSKFMDESFILNKYGNLNTPHISSDQWKQLAQKIKETKLLRNATTSVLPPTGRSAIVIGASNSIEPIFSLHSASDGIHPCLQTFLQKHSLHEDASTIDEVNQSGRSPKQLSTLNHPFITATELSHEDHLAMTIAAQRAIDESISKTINLPETITPQEIVEIYKKAYAAGLKGITVFRNNSRSYQPKKLSINHTDDKK